jgi:hypothetical protein
MINFHHIFAELECDLFGHIPSGAGKFSPIKVMFCHADGTHEKVADDTCGNCGHFIVNGITHMRKKKV